MIIVELCGLPGSGKSTLVSSVMDVPMKQKILTRNDLYSKSKAWRNIEIRINLLKYKLGILKAKSPVIEHIISEFPNASVHSKVRMIDLYNRISKLRNTECVLLLEEGPMQYLSSLAYDTKLQKNDLFFDYINLFADMNFNCIYCDCSSEVCVERIRGRNKSAGYYQADSADIFEKLNIKKENLITILGYIKKEAFTINMEDDLALNSKTLIQFIKDLYFI